VKTKAGGKLRRGGRQLSGGVSGKFAGKLRTAQEAAEAEVREEKWEWSTKVGGGGGALDDLQNDELLDLCASRPEDHKYVARCRRESKRNKDKRLHPCVSGGKYRGDTYRGYALQS